MIDSTVSVFGAVLDEGMTALDRIADLQIYNAGTPFNELPLYSTVSGSIQESEWHYCKWWRDWSVISWHPAMG